MKNEPKINLPTRDLIGSIATPSGAILIHDVAAAIDREVLREYLLSDSPRSAEIPASIETGDRAVLVAIPRGTERKVSIDHLGPRLLRIIINLKEKTDATH